MDIVVDVQFLKTGARTFAPKEVAIVSLKEDYVSHWIIEPPFSIKKLGSHIIEENNWLAKNHHSLSWLDGEAKQKSVFKEFQNVAKNAGNIYVRGREKKNLLREYVSGNIINLEENSDCPSFQNLPWVNKYCLHHSVKYCYLMYSCALNNAARLKEWLIKLPKQSEEDINSKEIQARVSEIIDDEQLADSGKPFTYTIPFCRSVPGRFDPSGVDETDCVCL